jgi:hypothetical protein
MLSARLCFPPLTRAQLDLFKPPGAHHHHRICRESRESARDIAGPSITMLPATSLEPNLLFRPPAGTYQRHSRSRTSSESAQDQAGDINQDTADHLAKPQLAVQTPCRDHRMETVGAADALGMVDHCTPLVPPAFRCPSGTRHRV